MLETPGAGMLHWTAVAVPAGADPTASEHGSWAAGTRAVAGPFSCELEARTDRDARYAVQDVMDG